MHTNWSFDAYATPIGVISTKSSMTGAFSEAATVNPSGAHECLFVFVGFVF